MPAMTINRWLAVRLEFLGSCLMFSTALTSVSALLISNSVDAGLVGLMMTYTISVTGVLVRPAYPHPCLMPKADLIELVGTFRVRGRAEHRLGRACVGIRRLDSRGCRVCAREETSPVLASTGQYHIRVSPRSCHLTSSIIIGHSAHV